jgi:hypothetical protein
MIHADAGISSGTARIWSAVVATFIPLLDMRVVRAISPCGDVSLDAVTVARR